MAIHQFFPTQVYAKQILRTNSNLHQNLLKECFQFRKLDVAGQRWSQKNYVNGYTSYGSLTNLHQISPYFQSLQKKLDHEVKHFCKALQMDLGARPLQLCSLWINMMPAQVTHSMHFHPLSVISGTYYVQIPKGTSGLKLEDPRLNSFMHTPPRKNKAKVCNKWFVELQPRAGSIFLFESWLRHEVPPNPSRQERISISFNYHWN